MATADVHLGMKFASYGPLQPTLAEARFEALSSVVASANQEECNILVVAGDLFHRVGVAAAIVERAAAILGEFAGEAVAVLPGNHDWRSTEGDRLWSSFAEAAGDRTMVLQEASAYDLRPFDLDAVLLAAPCDAMHGTEHRVGWMSGYEPPSPGLALIGVAHGSIEGLTLDAEGRYFPMSPELLGSLPPELWIVGHTHRQHHLPAARLVVPGTPEPDGFDFPEPGRAAVVDLADGRYEVRPLPTGAYSFVEVDLPLDTGTDIGAALDAALPGERSLVRLALHGSLDADRIDELRTALDERESRVLYLKTDESDLHQAVTQRDVDAWYATGSFANTLLSSLLAEGEQEAAGAALRLLRQAAGEPS
jgi:DNA repair exonuclease SbcCD nuclease subunit